MRRSLKRDRERERKRATEFCLIGKECALILPEKFRVWIPLDVASFFLNSNLDQLRGLTVFPHQRSMNLIDF